jgi:hypothetical protein
MADENNNVETKKYPSPFKDTDKAIGIFGKAQTTRNGFPRLNCMVGIDDLMTYLTAQKNAGRRVIYINAMESTWDKNAKANTLSRTLQIVGQPAVTQPATVVQPAQTQVTPDAIAQAKAILEANGKTVSE